MTEFFAFEFEDEKGNLSGRSRRISPDEMLLIEDISGDRRRAKVKTSEGWIAWVKSEFLQHTDAEKAIKEFLH